MPSRRPEALEALQEAAAGWRRRDALASPREAQAARLLAWMNSRPDQGEPVPIDQLDLSRPQPAGLPLLLPGDPAPWFVRLRLHVPLMASWIGRAPRDGIEISRTSPVAVAWHEEPPERANHAGALAMLREAAAGGPALAQILRSLGWPAAAAVVEKYADEDGIYEVGSGRAPREAPPPRRLLLAAFADRPLELAWLDHLCDGGDDWDSGPAGLPVPRGEALRPGQPPQAPAWLGLC